MSKLVYIVILNWNGWRDTIDCIDSCQKLSYPRFRILVVDNGSTDDSESRIRERFPEIEILQTGSNLGFAGGNNVGIRHALTEGADYVWLLNNDTVVDPEALGEMVRAADIDERIGLVGSKIYYLDKPDVLWFAGGGINRITKLSYHLGSKKKDDGSYREDREVDFITGCSLLVKSRVLNEVGLLREEFFLYAEDTEWNRRIKKSGWKIKWAAGSRVWHKVSGGHGERNPFLNYYCVRNILHGVRLNDPCHLPLTLASIVYNYVFMKLVQRDLTAVRWALVGFRDFMTGRFGRYEP
jgi:hypothetical protein